jgi:DNA-binding transcriptional regulator LsrR (DeoR family)
VSKRQEKLDLAARAAWLYYVAGKTQNEIAEQLDVSRQVAQRLVASAADQGLIKVSVHHRITACLELADAIRARFGLDLCEVVPYDHDGAEDLQRKFAVVGSRVIEHYLSREQPTVIELGTGRTLKAIVDELPDISRPQHRLISLVGTFAQDGSSNRYDVALRASDKTGGKYFLLPAPLLADSEEDRKQWCNHRLYRTVEQMAEQADVAFIGIGYIGPDCPLVEDGFLSQDDIALLMRQNAVAEVLGHTLDRDGKLIDSPIQQRVTSLSLKRPHQGPVIAFAGGEKKSAAILAALRGKWINGLVTDERSAREILQAPAS